ncbi:MAG: hypothetical protein J6S60_09165 [Oscillospiraceae bacterium]|nr:hypothetical protein [Oscillospiraceae bacterium]
MRRFCIFLLLLALLIPAAHGEDYDDIAAMPLRARINYMVDYFNVSFTADFYSCDYTFSEDCLMLLCRGQTTFRAEDWFSTDPLVMTRKINQHALISHDAEFVRPMLDKVALKELPLVSVYLSIEGIPIMVLIDGIDCSSALLSAYDEFPQK